MQSGELRKRIRYCLVLFIIGLVLSGITASPLIWEVTFLEQLLGTSSQMSNVWPGLSNWITEVYQGVSETDARYPFMLYGTDWLAFAHVVIAIAFWGPLRDPVKNVWVIEFGMIACILVIPTVLIFGPIRGIPIFWRALDCSFGVIGLLPLWQARRYVGYLAKHERKESDPNHRSI
jgi:hypothetical protein